MRPVLQLNFLNKSNLIAKIFKLHVKGFIEYLNGRFRKRLPILLKIVVSS